MKRLRDEPRGHTLKGPCLSATACSCTAYRRYGTLWAYGWAEEDITLAGQTTAYIRGDSLSFNFCPSCGNVSHWWGLKLNERGQLRVAVNPRLTAPQPIAPVHIRHFDGLDAWASPPDDGKCVRDLWF